MNRAASGDQEQSLPLGIIEIADQLNAKIDMVEHSDASFAVCTVLRVNTRVPQRDSHLVKRPVLAIGIHPHCHGSTGAERAE